MGYEFVLLIWMYAGTCTVIGILACFAWKFSKVVEEYRTTIKTMKGVDGPTAHFLFGHLSTLDPHESFIAANIKSIGTYPKMVVKWFGPFLGYLSLHFPDVIKKVLMTEEPKDNIIYNFIKLWLGDGLLISSGKKWKRNRRLLTPIFHFNVLKEYVKVFNTTSQVLLDKWKLESEIQDTTEITRDISLMTLDTMLQCTMSTVANCQSAESKNSYVESIVKLTEMVMLRMTNPILHNDFIFSLSPLGRRFRKRCDIAHKYTEDVIQKRKEMLKNVDFTLEDLVGTKKKITGRNLDFLDILLLTKDEKGIGLTDQEIRAEVDTFMFEGHDTTASGLSWAIYNLARHPEIQEKCREEVKEVLGDRSRVEWNDLSKFQYLTMCIKESMRIHPPVYAITRTLTKPMYFERGFGKDQFNVEQELPDGKCDKLLPPKTNVIINILHLHHNPHVWNNPEEYDPERFSLDNVEKRSAHAYLPFSSGPRNCIGQNFAMNEMKTFLALVLGRYRFFIDERCPKPERELRLILHSTNGIHVKIEKLV